MRIAILITLLFYGISPQTLVAQIEASERATLTQIVDGTEIIVNYSRPSLRGRVNIFKSEVPDSVLWTPGADSATTFGFNKPVTIEGVSVPAGRYSVWMVTTDDNWDVVLDTSSNRFHLPHPERVPGQIVFPVTPDTSAGTMESLVFYFPEVRSTGATLRLHWERTIVDLKIVVEPSRILTMTAEEAEPYLGRYAVEIAESPWDPGHSFELELTHTGEYLFGKLEVGPGHRPEDTYFAFAADQVFNPVWVINGTIGAVIDEMFIEFMMDQDGYADSFEARDPSDSVWMSGKRLKVE